MKTNNSFVNAAGKALAFSAAVIMGLTIFSCNKDKDKPETPANTVTIDGEAKTVTMTHIDKTWLEQEGGCDIFLYLSENEYINIFCDKESYEGKIIDLTKQEPDNPRREFWAVEYYNPNTIFDTYGVVGVGYPAFISGTLSVKRLEDDADGNPVFEIKLENGRVKGEGQYGDGKEHTVSVYYKGSLELDSSGPGPEPETPIYTATAVIDDVDKSISGVTIAKSDLEKGKYYVSINLSENATIFISVSKEHHDGKLIDLTKKEEIHDGSYWNMSCLNNGTRLFSANGNPSSIIPVFMNGTLYVKRLEDDPDGKPVFEIKLENGRVMVEGMLGDGNEHTISLNYNGSMELI